MSKAREIIQARIREIEEAMDDILAYEIDMVDLDCQLSNAESKRLDKKWHELFVIKCELNSLMEQML